MWTGLLFAVVLAVAAWLIYKRETYRLKNDRKNAPAEQLQKEVAALRKMGGDASDAPYVPPPQRRDPEKAPAKPTAKAWLKKLRGQCEAARLDQQITEAEARTLVQAFAEFDSAYPGKNAHATYVLEMLRQCLDDGRLDPREALELLTAIGEFADEELPAAVPEIATPPARRRERTPRKAIKDVSISAGQDYLLRYCDASGSESERVIRVSGLSANGGIQYIECYCTKAKAPRTFRVDRVRSLVDLSTGEVMI